jgi:hypothetical protein
MGRRSRSRAREVIVIAQREGGRETERKREVVRVLTNGTAWRQSYEDGLTTTLNRGGWWCSDGEVVLGMWRRD